MTSTARIIPFSIHRCFFSLSHCTRRLIHLQAAPSFAVRAWSHICHYSLSSRVVRSRFSDVSAFHTQSQIASDYLGWSSRILPEWSSFLESLASAGYSSSTVDFPAADCVIGFRMELLGLASVCLAFARDHPTLLGMLSRRDIEVLVGTGTPHCFKNGDETERRMQSYITSSGGGNSIELAMDKASLIDIMKYILSYTNDLCAPDARKGCNSALVESSLRSLLNELAKLTCTVLDSSLSGSVQSSFLERHEQPPRTLKKIEMKRGDWICPRCNFMNFARNIRCLECEGVRPNGRFNSDEWDKSVTGNGDVNQSLNTDSSNFGRKTTGNEEKSQRWLYKLSELNNGSDMRNAAMDEDLPEIMPLRKKVNSFTGKIPLERRLDNSNTQSQRNLGTDGNSINATLSRRIGRSLDRVLSESPSSSDRFYHRSESPSFSTNGSRANSCASASTNQNWSSCSAGTQSQTQPQDVVTYSDNRCSQAMDGSWNRSSLEGSCGGEPDGLDMSEEAKAERWFKRVAEVKDISELSEIPDEDFPSIMPMRKGVNRFVVSKRKTPLERRLTSQQHRRNLPTVTSDEPLNYRNKQ